MSKKIYKHKGINIKSIFKHNLWDKLISTNTEIYIKYNRIFVFKYGSYYSLTIFIFLVAVILICFRIYVDVNLLSLSKAFEKKFYSN